MAKHWHAKRLSFRNVFRIVCLKTFARKLQVCRPWPGARRHDDKHNIRRKNKRFLSPFKITYTKISSTSLLPFTSWARLLLFTSLKVLGRVQKSFEKVGKLFRDDVDKNWATLAVLQVLTACKSFGKINFWKLVWHFRLFKRRAAVFIFCVKI